MGSEAVCVDSVREEAQHVASACASMRRIAGLRAGCLLASDDAVAQVLLCYQLCLPSMSKLCGRVCLTLLNHTAEFYSKT